MGKKNCSVITACTAHVALKRRINPNAFNIHAPQCTRTQTKNRKKKIDGGKRSVRFTRRSRPKRIIKAPKRLLIKIRTQTVTTAVFLRHLSLLPTPPRLDSRFLFFTSGHFPRIFLCRIFKSHRSPLSSKLRNVSSRRNPPYIFLFILRYE